MGFTRDIERKCFSVSHIFDNYVGFHCVKSVQLLSFFWFVYSHIRTKYGEMKSVQILSFFWSVFSPIRTEY